MAAKVSEMLAAVSLKKKDAASSALGQKAVGKL